MNLDHLRAFCWLRWRLLANQATKGNVFNKVLLVVFAVGAVISSFGTFIGGIVVGVLAFALPNTPPWVMLVVWDGLIVTFLFAWSIGVLSELQRSEALSIDKFLHLPVSLAGVFALNYFSSFLSITLVMFVPMLVGLSLGLVISKGIAMLLLLPLLAAFILMVTAVTYQFQGWLATLMVNKRRRRAIIVALTFGFVLLFNLPNLLNVYFQPWNLDNQDELHQEQAELNLALQKKAITPDEFQKKMSQAQQAHTRRNTERADQFAQYAEQTAWIANGIFPPAWLALGASSVSEGDMAPALMGIVGMSLIGAASLWRGYRTTLRFYTGQFTAGDKTPGPAIASMPKTPGMPQPATLLEKKIPWLSEPAAVVALATFRSLTRAPEARYLLMAPIFMVLGFGFFASHIPSAKMPDLLRPLIAYAAMSMIIFTMLGLISNQFGLDRSGFKVYVLSPAMRYDILLGKNLAILPAVVVLIAPIFAVIEFITPMPIGYVLALPFGLVSIYLLQCLLANTFSILFPMPVASGALKPITPKVIPILMQFVLMLTAPLLITPVLLPWGIEAGLTTLEVAEGIPICVALSALECMAIVALYRWVLGLQGRLLQYRELAILDTVTTKAE